MNGRKVDLNVEKECRRMFGFRVSRQNDLIVVHDKKHKKKKKDFCQGCFHIFRLTRYT